MMMAEDGKGEIYMKLRIADRVEMMTESETSGSRGNECQMGDARVWQRMDGAGLAVILRAEQTPIRGIRLRWNFTPDEKRDEPVRVLGDEWERGYGTMEWRGIVTERNMPWVCAVSNGTDSDPDASGRFTECFGVRTRPAAFCMWRYDTHGVTLEADVRNGGCGVILGGREVKVCEILFEEYRDQSAFSALRAFYHSLCQDPIFPRAPVYGSNNWYYAYGQSSRENILADTDFLMARCGIRPAAPYMVIDDGWQPNATDGPWDRGNERFPDMRELAAEIKARGARPGIWIRYLNDSARETRGVTDEMRMNRDAAYLDPTHPAVRELIIRDTRRIVEEWGYELIKHDFSTYDLFGCWGVQAHGFLARDGWHFHDRSRTSAEIVVDFYRTIREAAGNAVIIGCNVIGHLAAGLVEMNRTGDDTSGREWERTRKMGVNTLAFRMLHHNTFYHADADCVGETGEIPWRQNREWLRALAYSGTPLFVSYDPALKDEAAFTDLTEAFQRSAEQKDELIPLDWMENTCPERWKHNGQEIRLNWFIDSES